MFKSLFAATAAFALLSGVPAQASDVAEESVQVAATAGVTADQAGRIVMQEGQAIGTLTEVMEEDNLAIIALMDGSEKQVSLTDLAVTEDGSIELVAMASAPADETTYE